MTPDDNVIKLSASEVLAICESKLCLWRNGKEPSRNPKIAWNEWGFAREFRFQDERTVWKFLITVEENYYYTLVGLRVYVDCMMPDFSPFTKKSFCQVTTKAQLIYEIEHSEEWSRLGWFMGQVHTVKYVDIPTPL